jgi:hypothetical protein
LNMIDMSKELDDLQIMKYDLPKGKKLLVIMCDQYDSKLDKWTCEEIRLTLSAKTFQKFLQEVDDLKVTNISQRRRYI